MKRLIAMSLLLCLLLCACGKKDEEEEVYVPEYSEILVTTQSTEETSETTEITQDTEPTEVTETTQVTETTEVTEPENTAEPAYRHPLTGEALTEPLLSRPYAVVIDNDNTQALPHWGVGDVDILWEMPHEGSSTRMIGILDDVSKTEKFGPTRSVRPYLLSVARSFGAILVHAGGSPQGYEQLKKTGWDNLDGVEGPGAGSYYQRDKSRLGKVDSWHTMYITGKNILKYTKKLGHDNTLDEMANYGLNFAQDGTPANGEPANTVTIRFRNKGRKTVMTYQQDTGDYIMEQQGSTYIDANNGATVHFENVIAIETKVGTIDDYGRLYQELEGKSGNGYFACGGKMVKIKWSRDGATDPFVFTLEDGTPLTLGVGKTYIAVVYNGVPVTSE